MLETIEGKSRRGWQRMKCLDKITEAVGVSLNGPTQDCRGQKGLEERYPRGHDLAIKKYIDTVQYIQVPIFPGQSCLSYMSKKMGLLLCSCTSKCIFLFFSWLLENMEKYI